jgi:predicted RNase H-like nuclease (RuvC/YqgF family)
MSEKKLLTGIEWLQSIKEMKNEQTIKAAARGLFKNRLQTITKRKKIMSEKLTAVEWFANEIDNLIPYINENVSKSFNELLDKSKQMENEQNIKAAARGFLNRQEEINSLTKKFKKDKIMNEKIIEKLMTENLMLSNDNVKLRQSYMQLLDVYCELIKAKNPDNLMLPGRNDWENKIK